jgi:hypothetical protein
MEQAWLMAAMVGAASLFYAVRYFPKRRVRVPGVVLSTTELAYQYEHDGQTYVGSSLSDPETAFMGRGRSPAASHHEPGEAVTVLVNPGDPRDATLSDRRLPRFLLGVAGLAVAVIIVARG